MMNRSGIETYELLRLDEVALAGYFDLEDTRFEEWYEKNRAVGDRLYSAILDRKIDLVAFRGTEDGRYYSILTRSPKQEGSLQLTDIDSKGPIGSRVLRPLPERLGDYGRHGSRVPRGTFRVGEDAFSLRQYVSRPCVRPSCGKACAAPARACARIS